MTGSGQGFVYLDANPIIYFVEGAKDEFESVRPLFETLKQRPGTAVTSEITLAEVLAPARRPGALPLHVKRRPYFELLVAAGFVGLVPVTRDLIYETAKLREVTRLKLVDSIHLVTAIHSKSRYFISRDADFRKMPKGMLLVRPEPTAIERLIATL